MLKTKDQVQFVRRFTRIYADKTKILPLFTQRLIASIFNLTFTIFLTFFIVGCNEFKVRNLDDESECTQPERSPTEMIGQKITFTLRIEKIEEYSLVIDFIDSSINGEFSSLETTILKPKELTNFEFPIYFQGSPILNGNLLKVNNTFDYTTEIPECFKDEWFFLKQ